MSINTFSLQNFHFEYKFWLFGRVSKLHKIMQNLVIGTKPISTTVGVFSTVTVWTFLVCDDSLL